MKNIIAPLKLFVILIWTIPLLTLQFVVFLFCKSRSAYIIPQFWHKGMCVILGIKIEIVGTPIHDRQIIYISNHISYLDISIIGSYLKASFIAKDDIASWPVIGLLARLQQTAFISRSSSKAKKVANALEDMVKDGKSLILFPEGTSTNGTYMMPFKSSLFSIALPKDGAKVLSPIPIQPFIIELLETDGKPLTIESRDLYAWYADMVFAPHIWIFMKTKGAVIRLTFLDIITPTGSEDRKELCKMVEQKISSGLIGA